MRKLFCVIFLTYTAISEELPKQLDNLPLELQKKVLEFARALNTTPLKGKPGRQLLRFAGTLDASDAKAMEETVEYGCERIDKNEWTPKSIGSLSYFSPSP